MGFGLGCLLNRIGKGGAVQGAMEVVRRAAGGGAAGQGESLLLPPRSHGAGTKICLMYIFTNEWELIVYRLSFLCCLNKNTFSVVFHVKNIVGGVDRSGIRSANTPLQSSFQYSLPCC